jgi:nucleoside-diphosphate-sugar epimerase
MVFVSGATGFLGAHIVCSLLQNGYTVMGLKRQTASLAELEFIARCRLGKGHKEFLEQVVWREGNILDYESLMQAMAGADYVIHAAASVSFWSKERLQMYEANVEGTANMLEVAKKLGVKGFCHVSSIAAIGRTKSGDIINEKNEWQDSPLNSHYGISKHLAEMEVWRAQEEGLPVVIVNPGVILGEGSLKKSSGRLLGKILSGIPYYTDGTNGYVDAIDVATCIVLLMQKQIQGQRFILVSENLSSKTIVNLGRNLAGKSEAKWQINKAWMQVAAFVLHLKSLIDGKAPLVNAETARTSGQTYTYSNAAIKEALGVEFMPVFETLQRTKEAFQD